MDGTNYWDFEEDEDDLRTVQLNVRLAMVAVEVCPRQELGLEVVAAAVVDLAGEAAFYSALVGTGEFIFDDPGK